MPENEAGASLTTTDHQEIRAWAEARGGVPADVSGTGNDGGVLRIEFRESNERLEEIDWDSFFRTFDDRQLEFLYQERTSDGEISRFNKFVRRDGDRPAPG